MAKQRFNIIFFVIYLVVMTAIMIWQGIGITPDRYFIVLILATLFVGRTKQFISDWMPFILILLAYDGLRGFADLLNSRVNYWPQLLVDNFLGAGHSPTAFLQSHLYQPGILHWYDYMATMVYFLQFALPLGFGFILWLKRRDQFSRFAHSILYLSYAAFFTYIIYPAAPPWLAARTGFLTGITKILDITLASFPDHWHLPTVYATFDPNTVAAVPSLHAAYPYLILLFAIKFFGKKGLIFAPYVLFCWFSLVYLGEHYIIDEILGVLYATIAFYLSFKINDEIFFRYLKKLQFWQVTRLKK